MAHLGSGVLVFPSYVACGALDATFVDQKGDVTKVTCAAPLAGGDGVGPSDVTFAIAREVPAWFPHVELSERANRLREFPSEIWSADVGGKWTPRGGCVPDRTSARATVPSDPAPSDAVLAFRCWGGVEAGLDDVVMTWNPIASMAGPDPLERTLTGFARGATPLLLPGGLAAKRDAVLETWARFACESSGDIRACLAFDATGLLPRFTVDVDTTRAPAGEPYRDVVLSLKGREFWQGFEAGPGGLAARLLRPRALGNISLGDDDLLQTIRQWWATHGTDLSFDVSLVSRFEDGPRRVLTSRSFTLRRASFVQRGVGVDAPWSLTEPRVETICGLIRLRSDGVALEAARTTFTVSARD